MDKVGTPTARPAHVQPEELAKMFGRALECEAKFDTVRTETRYARDAAADAWNELYNALMSLHNFGRHQESGVSPLLDSALWKMLERENAPRGMMPEGPNGTGAKW